MRTRWIVAAGMAAVGLVWVGQGLGFLRSSSFMVNDVRWAVAGAALLLIGAVMAWSAIRGGRRA
jgi:ABC-type nickel/cobalt efflux system permease component RcnA